MCSTCVTLLPISVTSDLNCWASDRMSAWSALLRETNMSFNVVSSTGWVTVGNSEIESCSSLVSREPARSLTSRAGSDVSWSLCLAVTGLEEHEED